MTGDAFPATTLDRLGLDLGTDRDRGLHQRGNGRTTVRHTSQKRAGARSAARAAGRN